MDEVQELQSSFTRLHTGALQLVTVTNKATYSAVRLEKIKMPIFSGNVRDWPRFKSDFKYHVEASMSSEAATVYALRSCLCSSAAAHVRPVNDNLSEMWNRLEERYGNPGKVVDVILLDLKQFRLISENENQKFISFVDMIEKAYLDLKRLHR
jgi:hypothetical protein